MKNTPEVNAALTNLEMIAAGKDLVTGSLLSPNDMMRLAKDAVAALTGLLVAGEVEPVRTREQIAAGLSFNALPRWWRSLTNTHRACLMDDANRRAKEAFEAGVIAALVYADAVKGNGNG
jgi:hypothetical protein